MSTGESLPTGVEELNQHEVLQVSGGRVNDLREFVLTDSFFRDINYFDLLGSGKQVIIDGIAIDTEGKLGPRP